MKFADESQINKFSLILEMAKNIIVKTKDHLCLSGLLSDKLFSLYFFPIFVETRENLNNGEGQIDRTAVHKFHYTPIF